MSTEFQTLAAPLRSNLQKAIAALTELEASDFEDEAALGRLARATYLAGLGAKGIAALAIADEDFAFARGSNLILNAD